MKRFALIPIVEGEDPQTANRKSWLRRRRLSKGFSISGESQDSDVDSIKSRSAQTQTRWQSQGRYEYEVEAVYGHCGHNVTQRYTGQTRCTG